MESSRYESYERTCRIEVDRVRIYNKIKPIHTDANEAIQKETENNQGTAFERYKDFVKKNFIGIAGLLITIGGVITSVALAMRNGTKRVANTTQKAKNSVEKVSGPIGNILGQILKNNGRIMSWFADHLMVLLLVVGFVIFKIKKNKSQLRRLLVS